MSVVLVVGPWAASAVGARATGLADPARQTALDQFLARHHASDPTSHAAIVSWLAEVTR